MKKNILLILVTAMLLSSCEDLLTPSKENFKDKGRSFKRGAYGDVNPV